MTQNLCDRFSEINRLLRSILITETMIKQMPHIPMIELKNQLEIDLTKIEPLLFPLEKAIQDRLHYEEA
jgi:hypothetical protein